MKIFSALLLFILVGCASKPIEQKKLEDITREDFKPVAAVKYTSKDDRLKKANSEFTQASNMESLQRIYKYDGDIELIGDMGEVAKLCYQKEFTEAKKLIKQVNKKFIKNPIFWNHVGTCFLLEGSRRKALLFFNKALALKPNYAPSLNNLGVMYMYENDFSRALVAFERARKSKEFSATPRLNLANLYLNFGLYDKSLTELIVLYGVSRSDVDVLAMLGSTYLMKNDVTEAVKAFKKIDSDFVSEPRVGINYSLALYLSGNKEDARDIFSDVDNSNLGDWKKYYKSIGDYLGVKK